MDMIKTPEQIEGIRAAAKINNACLDLIAQKIKAGMTTEEIDALAYDFITKSGGIPACLGFYGFPKSICTNHYLQRLLCRCFAHVYDRQGFQTESGFGCHY